MLVFTTLTAENSDLLLQRIIDDIPNADSEYLGEIISSLIEDCETEYALSTCGDCLAVRLFDNRYSFLYPIQLCDDADVVSAIIAIRDYAVKEEIPLIYTDVPVEELGVIIPIFRHANIDAADADCASYNLSVLTEVSLMDSVPRIYIDDITLDAHRAEDDSKLARLCRDAETNKYWGYDFALDAPEADDAYFRITAEEEFNRGVALSFAVRLEDDFVGEAILYSFNGSGECDIAVRILPEYRRRGIGSTVIKRLIEFCSDIGMVRVRCRVNSANKSSVKMCRGCFESENEIDSETSSFTIEL